MLFAQFIFNISELYIVKLKTKSNNIKNLKFSKQTTADSSKTWRSRINNYLKLKFNRKIDEGHDVKATEEGTVKFFNMKKGFGFIKLKDSDQDIFVHKSGIIDEIFENDSVKFLMQRGQKGINAVNVKLIK